ncbi:hypothetical protein [Streptomyces himastatinicus]|uniref:hypothetical protein n=1 Tax=Streptomyces himastatinicus TaxID=998084 RepID=UPI0001B4B15A|nr:hypothetical protein [Streptomyces himastatinicus]
MRQELAEILDNRAAIDLPVDLKTPADGLPEAQRSFLVAERLVPVVRQQQQDHPILRDLEASSRREGAVAQSVLAHALVEFCNEAHIDVLQRVHALLAEDDAEECRR